MVARCVQLRNRVRKQPEHQHSGFGGCFGGFRHRPRSAGGGNQNPSKFLPQPIGHDDEDHLVGDPALPVGYFLLGVRRNFEDERFKYVLHLSEDNTTKNKLFSESVMSGLGMYFLTVMVGLGIQGFIVLPLLYFSLTRQNPFTYIKHLGTAIITAFGTASR